MSSNIKNKKKSGFPIFVLIAAALLLIAVILAAVFFSSYFGVVHFTSDSGGTSVYDKRSGITYNIAPMCYQPVKFKNDKEYGIYKDTEFYRVSGVDPTLILTTDNDNIYDVYYNIEHPLPTLGNFKVDIALICEVGLIAIPTGALNNEAANKAAELIVNGEQCDMPYGIIQDSVVYLYFTSTEYDYLYYYIQYFRTEDGGRYLMDRSFDRCVNIGDELSDFLE